MTLAAVSPLVLAVGYSGIVVIVVSLTFLMVLMVLAAKPSMILAVESSIILVARPLIILAVGSSIVLVVLVILLTSIRTWDSIVKLIEE